MILNAGTSVRRVEKTFSLKTQASRGIFARFQHLKWSTNAASYMQYSTKLKFQANRNLWSLQVTTDDFFSIEIFSRVWWLFRSCLSLSVGRENVMRDEIINTAM